MITLNMDRKQHTKKLLEDYEIERSHEAKQEIENNIITINDALCASVAWKFKHSRIEVEDAMQIARMAMLRAIRTYNGTHQFSTHAVTLMRNDILNVLKNDQRSKRKHKNLSLDKPLPDGKLFSDIVPSKQDIATKSVNQMLIKNILDAAPALLTEKEYQVFLYAIEYTKHTRDSLALELNVTVQYVTTLKKKALVKIRKKFRDKE